MGALEGLVGLLSLVLLGGSLGLARARRRLAETLAKLHDRTVEHEQTLERLRENENRLRAIIESEPECVKLQAADGTILDMNPAGLDLIEAERREDFIGRPVYEVIAPEHQQAYRDFTRRVFDGTSGVCEFKIVSLKGRTRWMESHGAPLRDAQGRVCALLGITRDITEQRNAEEQQRRHLTELAHVARLSTLGEAATGIAHELNQPLSTIANYARGCIRRLETGQVDCRELSGALEEIYTQAEHAGEIIRHVREFVRKREPQLRPASLNGIVRAAVRLSEPEALQFGARIRLELVDSLPTVRADAIMVEQVICNLVRNAIDAMADAESARREVTLRTRRAGEIRVEVEVSDTGPGIPAADRNRVFDQFYTTKPDGIGMGLSMSRSIVEAHGGELRLDFRASAGACFVFSLAAEPERAAVGAA